MLNKLMREQRLLMLIGLLHFILFLVLAFTSLFDSEQILGIERWIKPMKFAISISIYLWTLAVYLLYIKGFERTKRVIALGTSLMLLGETIFITMQSARGTTSHFNIHMPFDGMVFAIMGVMIAINTFLIIYLLIILFRAEIDLPKSIIWGMRLGVILFVLASVEGGLMSSLLRHSVGVADGGPGLPVVNWSTTGGDLRVAHFIGLHAFQAISFFAYTLERYNVKSSTMWTVVFAVFYFLLFSGLFVQAWSAQPLLSMLYYFDIF